MKSILLPLSFLSIMVTQPVVATNYFFVADDGSGDFATIQAAANAADHGDVIELGEGTFSGAGNRDVNFRGKSLTIRSQSGSRDAVIDCEGSEAEPRRAFLMTGGGELEGLVIQRGVTLESGGAVLAVGGRVTIRNCTFYENSARGDTGPGAPTVGEGGALAFFQCASITIDDCTFEYNEVGICGGGVGLLDCQEADITNCRFESNFSWGTSEGAGGVAVIDCPSVRVDECQFVSNQAQWSSGGLGIRGSTVTVTGCHFEDNFATAQGDSPGGSGASGAIDSVVDYVGCEFRENGTNWVGGASAVVNTRATFTDCLFVGNQACHAGIFFNYVGSTATLTDCTMIGNQGEDMFWNDRSSLTVTNCTIADNVIAEAPGSLSHPPCVFRYGWEGSIEMRSSIVAYNSAPAFMAGHGPASASESFECSNVFGNSGGDWDGTVGDWATGGGNISLDPCFCDPGAEQLYLASNSPCAEDNSDFGQMGAWSVGCSSAPPQEPATWGGIKEEFRIP